MGPFGVEHLWVFCSAVLLLNLTPGPDTAYIVGRSLAQGRWAGIVSVLGISAGCSVHTLAATFGLTAILAASAAAFSVIKVIGAIYLGYLGLRLLLGTSKKPNGEGAPAGPGFPSGHAQVRSMRRLFAEGFLTNVLNPKVALFFMSFFPQFVAADSPSKPMAFLFLGLVLIAMSTIYNGAVAWLAGGITARMRRAPAAQRWLERAVGTAFIGLAVRLALLQPSH